MGSIAAVFSYQPESLSGIGKMIAAQAHGGSGGGYALIGTGPRVDQHSPPPPAPGDFLALGHVRLPVLDKSELPQPIASSDGSCWIVFDGEIYNVAELRSELEALGARFLTGTDAEVVIAAYQLCGTDCFRRFNGMWALVLWDQRKACLVLSRDRLGIKPLHYTRCPGGWIFASEIKGLLAACLEKPRMHAALALDFLELAAVSHTEDTLFQGIKSFPPGSYAVLHSPSDEVTPKKFWSLEDPPPEGLPSTFAEACEHFSRLLQDAVRLRLGRAARLGACLSGGLDSSAIVCQASAQAGDALDCFTAGSESPKLDERHWARMITDRTGSRAHPVLPTAQGFSEALEALIWHQEEPFASSSVFAQWLIMAKARETGTDVLLGGQGADEILCGYRKYAVFRLLELLRAGRYHLFLAELLGLAYRGDRGTWDWRSGRRHLSGWLLPRSKALAFLPPADAAPSRSLRPITGTIRDRQILDVTALSLPSLLRYQDRNARAFGVETRAPFLDHRLVEWCVALPPEFKLAGGRTKRLLRDAARGQVPQAIIDRRDKIGFATDQDGWIRGAMAAAFRSTFEDLPSALRDLVDQTALTAEFDRYLAGRSALGHQEFFRVFILARWIERMGVGS